MTHNERTHCTMHVPVVNVKASFLCCALIPLTASATSSLGPLICRHGAYEFEKKTHAGISCGMFFEMVCADAFNMMLAF